MPHFSDSFIIPRVAGDGGRPALLLVSQADGWSLPRWVHPARHGRTGRELDDPWWPLVIQHELRRQLGLDVSVLHADLHDERDAATGNRRSVVVLENLSPAWSPPAGARWADRDAIDRLTLAPWPPRSVVLDWLDEAEVGTAHSPSVAARPPWQRPGWLAAALAWIGEQVARHGHRPTGPAEQLGTKVGRYLLRLPTTGGAVYFKAVPPMYAREIGVLRLLSADAPARAPELLAVDLSRHWHLTRDHGGTALSDADDLATWEWALEALGRLQAAYSGRDGDLLAAGCTDLRPGAMLAEIEPLLADRAALRVGQAGGLLPGEVVALAALAPRLQVACRRLAAFAVPSSLVHGDFIPANVAVENGAPVFVDWCEATVSHPFFSAVRFLASADWRGRAVRDDPTLYDRLRGAYLRAWVPCASLADLLKAFELASALQPLQYALTYWHLLREHAASGQDVARWERRGVAALSLRRLLDRQTSLP